MVFISTLFLQSEQGMSPFAAGLVFVPSAVVMVVTNVFSGQVINAMGTRFTVSIGLIAWNRCSWHLLFAGGCEAIVLVR